MTVSFINHIRDLTIFLTAFSSVNSFGAGGTKAPSPLPPLPIFSPTFEYNLTLLDRGIRDFCETPTNGRYCYGSYSNCKYLPAEYRGLISKVASSTTNSTAYSLGVCLHDAREFYKNADDQIYPRTIIESSCSMLTSAANLACIGSAFANNPKSNSFTVESDKFNKCTYEFIEKIGRTPGWYKEYGYCSKHCQKLNLPILNFFSIDAPPCSYKYLPPDINNFIPDGWYQFGIF